jgi:hypothetical protein
VPSSRSRRRQAVAGGTLALLAHTASARADGPSDVAPEGDRVVQVRAAHREVGETTVRREDTHDLPGTFGDPMRFAETLPGVVPTASGLQAFFVRGAPPTATGYFIDGIPVPALYHVGFGPSVIHPGLIDHVDFYQGAPPAAYGHYVGGALDATTAAPEARPHAEANLRLFDAGALGETPFADGRGSALVAARYGYPALILPLFAPGTGLSYWDYQARATWNVAPGDRIGVLAFGSNDALTQRQDDSLGRPYTQQLVADQFHRLDLRWDRVLGGSAGTLRLAATLGRDLVGDDVASAIDDVARLRAELDVTPSPTLRVRAGADVQVDRLRPGPPPEGVSGGGTSLALARDAVVMGAHADAVWRVSRAVEVTPGLRADVYATDFAATANAPASSKPVGASATPVLEPRFAARIRVVSGVTLSSTFGISHQLPGIVAQYPETTPFIQPGVLTGLQSSIQASQGVLVALPARFSIASTAFLHHYTGLPDFTACAFSPVDPSQCVTPAVDGQAFGLEVLLRRPFTDRFTVWVSYTLSRSTREAHLPGNGQPYAASTATILSEYDRTHVLSAVASFDLGKSWRIGGRLFAYSGRPYTAIAIDSPVMPYDSQRLPGFFRIDARLEKAWLLGGKDRIAVVLEGVNVTLNKEVVSATCGLAVTSPRAPIANTCTLDAIGPITIPSIGVEATFR